MFRTTMNTLNTDKSKLCFKIVLSLMHYCTADIITNDDHHFHSVNNAQIRIMKHRLKH